MSTAVEMAGIVKQFGAMTALDHVDLSVESGHIHALVGENGAGKTTLMRILYGLYHQSEGEVRVNGSPVKFRNAKDALAAGIGMVSQHYAIIPELTCLQNLMLGAEPGMLINMEEARVRAAQLAQQMGFQFEWDREAAELGPAGSQKLEILKLLWRNSKIMILDEPTAMLSPSDADALFESLKQLQQLGSTVILVTHRLPEVLDHCDRVTVLRGGRLIASRDVNDVTAESLAADIVGHSLGDLPPKAPIPTNSLLTVEKLTVKGDRGDDAVKGASFGVNQGEMLGIAGVDGNGQRELFQALMGVRKAAGGSTQLQGESLDRHTTVQRIKLGVRLIPEDRHDEGVIEDWTLAENAALGFQRFSGYSNGTFFSRDHGVAAAESMVTRFDTKCTSVQQKIGSLSGGNQQRFVAARALSENPSLILAFQPTRGLDIDATRAVYQGIREECQNGAGALVVSFDLDELLTFCDRVIVIEHGKVTEPATQDRGEIGRLMVGAS